MKIYKKEGTWWIGKRDTRYCAVGKNAFKKHSIIAFAIEDGLYEDVKEHLGTCKCARCKALRELGYQTDDIKTLEYYNKNQLGGGVVWNLNILKIVITMS